MRSDPHLISELYSKKIAFSITLATPITLQDVKRIALFSARVKNDNAESKAL